MKIAMVSSLIPVISKKLGGSQNFIPIGDNCCTIDAFRRYRSENEDSSCLIGIYFGNFGETPVYSVLTF
jgi:hypothetical protein